MKNSVKITTSILILFLSITSFGYGQEEVKINRRKNLYFKGESENAEVKINSTKDYNYLNINLNCSLSEGKVTIEIINPKGEKQGAFTIKTDEAPMAGKNTESDQSVNGSMSKVFGKPVLGEWIIKASPSEAAGSLNIMITQGFEPRIDLIDIRTLKNQ